MNMPYGHHKKIGEKYFFSKKPFRLIPTLIIIFIALIGLNACQDGAGEEIASTESGDVIIGLTDAKGDFLSYTVDVLSLSLTKANGTVIETLPLSTRVDFSQYTDMTEFLTAATIPSGNYTKASMVLDYQNADIQVENEEGSAVQVELIIDNEGEAITNLDVSVRLDGIDALVIAPGTPAHMTLDFDLQASNKIAFDETELPTLTVDAFLLADLKLDQEKQHRLRGPLKNVDVDNAQFEVILRPFSHPVRRDHRDERFGTLIVSTSETTQFEINGENFYETGLEELATLPSLTAIVVLGDLKTGTRIFEATDVYAGSSVPGGDQDVVRGNVIKRNDEIITVRGATMIRDDGTIIFNNEVSVLLSSETIVKKQLSMNELSIDDISIGQRVIIFGELLDGPSDDSQAIAFDASNGLVRLMLTRLSGTVIPTISIPEQSPPFVVDVKAIGGHRVTQFDFSGTGIDTENDSEPDFYEIKTTTLDTSSLSNNGSVKVRGFVAAYGQAPEDFSAQTIIDIASAKAVLATNWRPATDSPFLNIDPTGLSLNMSGTGQFHHVNRSGVVTNLYDLTEAPQIIPHANEEGVFVIRNNGIVNLHTRFSSFVDALTSQLESGALLKSLRASGNFDDSSSTLSTRRMLVRF